MITRIVDKESRQLLKELDYLITLSKGDVITLNECDYSVCYVSLNLDSDVCRIIVKSD